ncbi:hypothetical protein [Deinococcus roseus]|uniref:Lipoprotein n=1 Tax=Deinococcus roseus TaxID=392414 RepID=A0ABQ2DGV7_9DEIO|nr:hypothetical protein [Deinococcus roseus]GGJ57242.1 hypothetical protein GCM10008938_49210 [Deinococcus roseus]
MKKYAFLIGILMLTACNTTIQIPFASSPLILRGEWQGETIPEEHFITLDSKRNQLVRFSEQHMLAQDVQTGDFVNRNFPADLKGILHHRTDDTFVKVTAENTQILSAETFQVLKTFPLTGVITEDADHLVQFYPETAVYSLNTGEKISASLKDFSPLWTFSETGQYAIGSEGVIDTSSGKVLPITLSHHKDCAEYASAFPVAVAFDASSAVLSVAYIDGFVEFWDTSTWTFQKSIPLLPSCYTGLIKLWSHPGQLDYAADLTPFDQEDQNVMWGRWNLKTSQHVFQQNLQLKSSPLSLWPALNVLHQGDFWTWTLGDQIWTMKNTSTLWHQSSTPQPLKMNLQAEWLGEQSYRITGTLNWNNQTHLVEGLAHGTSVVFKQSLLPPTIWVDLQLWNSDKTVETGTLKLSMSNLNAATPQKEGYRFLLQVQNERHAGILKRK